MPELAEVYYYRKLWAAGIGDNIVAADLHAAKRIFRGSDTLRMQQKLPGSKLASAESHGKQMLFGFSGGLWLGIHLGMSGKLSVEEQRFPIGKHDHLVLRQKKRALVFNDPRQFGRVRFDESRDPPEWWASLPPEITSRKFTLLHLHEVLARRRKAPIKAVLLTQDAFPGIGNWMADEVLWQAHIHPAATTAELTDGQLRKLWQSLRHVVKDALATVGEDFSDPPKSWLFRHRWKSKGYCPRCAAALARATIGGRTTCWCPDCQPAV